MHKPNYNTSKKNNLLLREILGIKIVRNLPDILVRDAVKLGVKLTLGTDTHSIDMMDNMKYGVYIARRGWAEKKNVINCLSLEEFKRELKRGD